MSADDGGYKGPSWSEIIDDARSEALRQFCADPTGYVLEEMATKGNFSRTGPLLRRVCEQVADLRKRLAESEARVAIADQTIANQAEMIRNYRQTLTGEREIHTMQLAAISTATVQNTKKSVSDRIGPGHQYCTQTYLDVCRAVDREIAHREEKEASQRATAAAEPQTISEVQWNREDLRGANAVAAERRRICTALYSASARLAAYAKSYPLFDFIPWRKAKQAYAASEAYRLAAKTVRNPVPNGSDELLGVFNSPKQS